MEAQAHKFRLRTQLLTLIMTLHGRFDFLVADLGVILQQPGTPCFKCLGEVLGSAHVNPKVVASILGSLHAEQLQELLKFFTSSQP